MGSAACRFPQFAEAYLPPSPNENGRVNGSPPSTSRKGEEEQASPRQKAAGTFRRLNVGGFLPRLNVLESLPRDDGPPTELRARKQKLAFYERQCSHVGDRLFVASEAVAKSRELLRESGITHVVNCVGFLYPPFFEDELTYKVLYLQDTPGEDILSVLYDVFDFVEEAGEDGRVLVHCSQGVSRSATLAIAYLMWKREANYDDVFTAVKACRGVANPNIGFICQLLQWHKRRSTAVDRCRLYRIAPQSASAPLYLVAKGVSNPQPGSLDPRGAFVVQTPDSLMVWAGAACSDAFVAAAERFARQLVCYERAPGPPILVRQGREPDSFWAALVPAVGSRSSDRAGSQAQAERVAAAAVGEEEAAAGAAAAGEECGSYDKDFEIYQRSLTACSSGENDSARSGKKTPRDEDCSEYARSPNDRLRKQARGAVASEAEEAAGVAQAAAAAAAMGNSEAAVAVPGEATTGAHLARSRSKSPMKSPTRRLSRQQTNVLERGLGELERGISMDSAAQELVRTDKTLEEEATPPGLLRAASDVTPPTAEGSLTARSLRLGEAEEGAAEREGAVAAAGGQESLQLVFPPRPAGEPALGHRPAVPPINLKAFQLGRRG